MKSDSLQHIGTGRRKILLAVYKHSGHNRCIGMFIRDASLHIEHNPLSWKIRCHSEVLAVSRCVEWLVQTGARLRADQLRHRTK
jgi:hypothetical protein